MKFGKIIAVVIGALWLVTMAMLVQRHYGSFEAPAGDSAPPSWMLEESWAGIYQGTNKVGYASGKMTPTEDGYMAVEDSFMKLTVMGSEKDITMTSEAQLDKALRLRSFTFKLESDVNVEIDGKVQGRDVVMTLDMGGVKTDKTIHMTEAPYMSPTLTPLLKNLAPGKKIRVPMVDPSTLAGDEMTIEVLGKDKITVMGLARETYKLRGMFKGAEFTMWATDEGEVIKQESMGITFIKESEEEAKKLGTSSADLIADIAVPVDAEISEGATHLKVRLLGIDTEGLELDGGVQKLTDGNVVEINVPKTLEGVVKSEGLDQYLGNDFLLETDDPAIKSRAAEIVSNESDTLKKARLIERWVFSNVRKVPTMTLPSALEVLRSMRGDCNEHTSLYTALARAAGVPTRIAVGIVYQDGKFYYHAWPEIYLNDWVPIDPTLGQFPADATHIRLLTGGLDKQLRLGSVIGKLKIEVVEAR